MIDHCVTNRQLQISESISLSDKLIVSLSKLAEE